jgi:hypothetical protein
MARKLENVKAFRKDGDTVLIVTYIEDGQVKKARRTFTPGQVEERGRWLQNFTASADNSPD